MRIALALILFICSCFSGLAEAALPEVTDAASFAEACTALDDEEGFSTCAFSDLPTAVVLDDERFAQLLADGTGVVLIASPEDNWTRLLAPVLFDVMAENSAALQLYLPNDNAVTSELLQRLRSEGTSLTGSKPLAEALAADDTTPYGCALFLKEGQVVGYHVGTLKAHEQPPQALEASEADAIADMLQFQLDKLLSAGCNVGC